MEKGIMKLHLLGAVCACLVNVVHAASLSTAAIDWNTFTITANGTDVTNSINWIYQADFVDSQYIEGATSGISTSNNYDVDPNTEWAAVQNTNDGEIASRATTSLSTNLVSASTEVNYTGRADARIFRHGEFFADAATYTFSVDYTVSAEVNSSNSESGGENFSLDAAPYVEIFVSNESAGKDTDTRDTSFYFEFDEMVGISNGFGSDTNSGTLSAVRDFNDNLLTFLEGDLITIDITAMASSRSYSSVPPPATVSVPPAIWLFGSGLLGLIGIARR